MVGTEISSEFIHFGVTILVTKTEFLIQDDSPCLLENSSSGFSISQQKHPSVWALLKMLEYYLNIRIFVHQTTGV